MARPTLRVLSWNVHGLPWPFATHMRTRGAAIVRAIAEAAPDIVLLQEVWTQEAIDDFTRLLRATGFDVARPIRNVWGRLTGGLLTLYRSASVELAADATFSRYRSTASRFRLWEGDGASGKGALITPFRTAAGAMTVVNTHLQSQYGLTPGSARARLSHFEVRARQFHELRRLIAAAGAGPWIAAGDFNTFPEELSRMPITGWRELTEPLRVRCGCGTYLEGAGTWWFDYAFADARASRHWKYQTSLIANRQPDVPFSDHNGLIVDISRSIVDINFF